MRIGFGLVSILVCAGIIAYYWGNLNHPADTVRKGEDIKKDVRQWAGQDETGMKTSESITLEPRLRNGKLEGIIVEDLVPNGPMETYFGLQLDDVIIAAGPMNFRDLNNDADMAEALVLEAYQRRQPLVVLRNGQQITLSGDVDGGGGDVDGGGDGASAANAASGEAEEAATPLQRQLNAIRNQQAPGQ